MSPADIAAAELRAGLSRRLAELGLVPPDPAIYRVSALPVPPAPAPRRTRRAGGMSAVAGLRGGARLRPALRPAAVLAVASASSFLVYLDATIVNVAFPDIRASFSGATLAGLSWILSAYGLVFAALLVPGGRYADVVGGRRLFLAGLGRVHGRLDPLRGGAVGAAARRRARAAGRRRRAARARLAAARHGRVPARAADEGDRRDGRRRRARLGARAGARRADGRPRRLAARVPRQPADRARRAGARAGGCPRRRPARS